MEEILHHPLEPPNHGNYRTMKYVVQDLGSVFVVVEPSKMIFLISKPIPQKEDIILLYIGYHSTPK